MKGFSNYYITSCGKIWSYTSNRFLQPTINERGYKRIRLVSDEGKVYNFYIHRLVALEYVPNPNNLETVDHIDGDKTHNYANNLQWMTLEDNTKKAKNKKIYCLENNKVYLSQTEAAKELGLNQGNISKVCRGVLKQTGGYHFSFY